MASSPDVARQHEGGSSSPRTRKYLLSQLSEPIAPQPQTPSLRPQRPAIATPDISNMNNRAGFRSYSQESTQPGFSSNARHGVIDSPLQASSPISYSRALRVGTTNTAGPQRSGPAFLYPTPPEPGSSGRAGQTPQEERTASRNWVVTEASMTNPFDTPQISNKPFMNAFSNSFASRTNPVSEQSNQRDVSLNRPCGVNDRARVFSDQLWGPLYSTPDSVLSPTPSSLGDPIPPVRSRLTGGYIPMQMAQGRTGDDRLDDEQPLAWRMGQLRVSGNSVNYRGDPTLASNQSAEIPGNQSTAVWITNLPPDCTYPMLLDAIRGCGKIYASVINPPGEYQNNTASTLTPQTRYHTTSASKVVFWDRRGADALINLALSGGFVVGSYLPRVCLNRVKSEPRVPGPQSRVLHIEGPEILVNETFLKDFFKTKFSFDLERVITLSRVPQPAAEPTIPTTPQSWANIVAGKPRPPVQPTEMHVRQEWRFGSYRCQAEAARAALIRERERIDVPLENQRAWQEVRLHWGPDPCALPARKS